MRISDWSSDVCSSDLPPDVEAEARRRWALLPEYRGRRHFRRGPVAGAVRKPHVQCRQQDHGQWLQSACRSEEHTSELQSLMRISYAVFCLKKKKNTYEQD